MEVRRGLLPASDQQRCRLTYLPFDKPTEQVQQPVPMGGR
jgi:hypothetical protein